jgi:serine/threonine-protein kinase
MSPLSENPTSVELERWLQEAREGSGEGLSKTLAFCRDYLVAVALAELPVGPGRETLAVDLASTALQEVRVRLASFEGHSEGDLRSWLKQLVVNQARLMKSPPYEEDLANLSTPDPGIAVTADSRPVAAAKDLQPPTQSLSPQSIFDQATKAAPGTSNEQGYSFPAVDDATLPAALAELEGFQIVQELGRGGMGIVYRAWQERLQRWVALKCLPAAFSEDPERLRRFREEARLTAQLTEHGIIQVHDIVEAGNTPILVLPFIDGCDLAQIIKQRQALQEGKSVDIPHPWATLKEADYLRAILPFFDKVLDSLVRLHGAGVLHRDLKPSNILLDKNANSWLTDFGLARMGHLDTTTQSGHGMGTPGFMSPEQWDGDENIDARTDVFGIGVTIYQALTLKLPYGKTKIKETNPPVQLPKTVTRRWPAHLDLVLQKAIQPDRAKRYQSVADFRDDWVRVRNELLPKGTPISPGKRIVRSVRRKMVYGLASVALLSVVGLMAAVFWQPTKKDPDAKSVVRTVHLKTDPPDARVVLIPLRYDDGSPQFDKAIEPEEHTPLTIADVPPGDYLVIVEVKDYGFHEVYRRVPEPGAVSPIVPEKMFLHTTFEEQADNSVDLPLIRVPKSEITSEMASLPGGKFIMGSAEFGPDLVPPHLQNLDPFFLDKTEVTVEAYRVARQQLPAKLTRNPPANNEAVRLVTFDDALECAEKMGKRLPEEAEYEYVATNAGENRFPWGDDFSMIQNWTIGPVGKPDYDRSKLNPSVFGLYSNVAEWTNTWAKPYPGANWPEEAKISFRDMRIVRGGPTCVLLGDPDPQGKDKTDPWHSSFRQGIPHDQTYEGLGFRCARSVAPRFPQPSPERP